jgi:hypothetical protein
METTPSNSEPFYSNPANEEAITREIRDRFQVLDSGIIFYDPLPETTELTVKLWTPILREYVDGAIQAGQVPLLMLDLVDAKSSARPSIRKLLVDEIRLSRLKAIAGFGIHNFLIRAMFTFVIRAGTLIPGKFFKHRHEAEAWLTAFKDNLLNHE